MFGQYVILEATLLDDMWANSRCENPCCVDQTLQSMGVNPVGGCLTGHFRCPRCNTGYTRATDFLVNNHGTVQPEINVLYGVAATHCGLSPTSVGRAQDFMGILHPPASSASAVQKRNLSKMEQLGRDACLDMLEMALEDARADPLARFEDGNLILDVAIDGSWASIRSEMSTDKS
jgi:hypothetical protein